MSITATYPHPDTAGTDEPWLKPAAAAALLGISLSTLYRLVSQDAIPHRRVGRSLRFVPAELRTYNGAERVVVRERGSTFRARVRAAQAA